MAHKSRITAARGQRLGTADGVGTSSGIRRSLMVSRPKVREILEGPEIPVLGGRNRRNKKSQRSGEIAGDTAAAMKTLRLDKLVGARRCLPTSRDPPGRPYNAPSFIFIRGGALEAHDVCAEKLCRRQPLLASVPPEHKSKNCFSLSPCGKPKAFRAAAWQSRRKAFCHFISTTSTGGGRRRLPSHPRWRQSPSPWPHLRGRQSPWKFRRWLP